MIRNSILIWVLALVVVPVISILISLSFGGRHVLMGAARIQFIIGLAVIPAVGLLSGILAACGKMNILVSILIAMILSVIFLYMARYELGLYYDNWRYRSIVPSFLNIWAYCVAAFPLLPTLVGYWSTNLIRFIGRNY